MTQIGITSKESEPYPVLESNSKNECFGKEWPKLVLLRRRHLQPASQGSQPNKTPNTTSQPANQPTSQPKKTNQPGNQIQILSEKVMPKTWCLGGNDPNWNYFQRDWTLPCPKKSNSKNECFSKEWPKLVLLRRRHLQPASQGSQPNKTPNTTSQPANQPAKQTNKTNQPGNQIQILSEKVMPKTWCPGGNDPNWNYFQREWALPCMS